LTPTVGLSDFTDRPTKTPAVNKIQNNATYDEEQHTKANVPNTNSNKKNCIKNKI